LKKIKDANTRFKKAGIKKAVVTVEFGNGQEYDLDTIRSYLRSSSINITSIKHGRFVIYPFDDFDQFGRFADPSYADQMLSKLSVHKIYNFHRQTDRPFMVAFFKWYLRDHIPNVLRARIT